MLTENLLCQIVGLDEQMSRTKIAPHGAHLSGGNLTRGGQDMALGMTIYRYPQLSDFLIMEGEERSISKEAVGRYGGWNIVPYLELIPMSGDLSTKDLDMIVKDFAAFGAKIVDKQSIRLYADAQGHFPDNWCGRIIVRFRRAELLAQAGYDEYGQSIVFDQRIGGTLAAGNRIALYNGCRLDELKELMLLPDANDDNDDNILTSQVGNLIRHYYARVYFSYIAREEIDLEYCRIFDGNYSSSEYISILSTKLGAMTENLGDGDIVIAPVNIYGGTISLVIARRARQEGQTRGEVVVGLFAADKTFYNLYQKDGTLVHSNFYRLLSQFGSAEEILRESADTTYNLQASASDSYHNEGFLVAATRYLKNNRGIDPAIAIQHFRSPEFIVEWAKATTALISNGTYDLLPQDMEMDTEAMFQLFGIIPYKIRDVFNMETLYFAKVGLAEDTIGRLYFKYAYQFNGGVLGTFYQEGEQDCIVDKGEAVNMCFRTLLYKHIKKVPEDATNIENLEKYLQSPEFILQWVADYMTHLGSACEYKFRLSEIVSSNRVYLVKDDKYIEAKTLFNNKLLFKALDNLLTLFYKDMFNSQYNIVNEAFKNKSKEELEAEYGYNPLDDIVRAFKYTAFSYIEYDEVKDIGAFRSYLQSDKFAKHWAIQARELVESRLKDKQFIEDPKKKPLYIEQLLIPSMRKIVQPFWASKIPWNPPSFPPMGGKSGLRTLLHISSRVPTDGAGPDGAARNSSYVSMSVVNRVLDPDVEKAIAEFEGTSRRTANTVKTVDSIGLF